tara:strand:+ start:903 stop:1163 length:261 start_codon:yes stop_codon:yes gene_type:complete
MTDHSLKSVAAFGSARWVADRLGVTPPTFHSKRSNMEAEGFPTRDPILNMYIKADVDAWIKNRRKISDSDKVEVQRQPVKVKYDAL